MQIVKAGNTFHFVADKPSPVRSESQARAELLAAGLTEGELNIVTGFGQRHISGMKPDDTILNKYRFGALSMIGVMGSVFGSDSPQHHAGNALR